MTRADAVWGRTAFAAVSLAILTTAFLWPALVTGTPWSFPDTPSYYKGGAAAWAFLIDALGLKDAGLAASDAVWVAPPLPDGLGEVLTTPGSTVPDEAVPTDPEAVAAESPPVATDGSPADRNVRYGIRSVPYSILVYASVRFVSLWAPIAAMCLAIATLIWMTARDVPPALRLAIGLGLAAVTVLPFFGALFQPDILTAAVVFVPIVVMLHGDRLGLWRMVALLALFAFAALAHYGNLPLAGVAVLWLAVWGLMRGRRLVVALVVAPLVVAVLVNVAIGLIINAGPSLAPGRYPLLLARSIEDGPGEAYLAQACPEANWALCEVYDEVPSNIFTFLWGPRSVSEVATPEQLARISAEELPLLMAIVRYDPAGQARAFLANSVRQFFLYGSAEGSPARYAVTPRTMEVAPLEISWTPSVPTRAQDVAILLGVFALLWAIIRRRHPEALATASFLLASLVVYAAVCGGLSAPAPRYQARLVWIIPLLGAVLAYGRPRGRVAVTGTAPTRRPA